MSETRESEATNASSEAGPGPQGEGEHNWHELTARREQFQEILELLVEYDERSGRLEYLDDMETHFMRRSVAAASPQQLRVFLRDLGEHVFRVVVQLQSTAGVVVTAWIHEDGIQSEREALVDEPEHPVHSITCMTDLYNSAHTTRVSANEPAVGVSAAVHRVMGEG